MVDILQILLHVELKDWSSGVRQYQETARKHAGCTITYSTLAVWILWLLDRSPASRHPSLTNRFSANTIQKESKKKTIQKEVKTSFWILKPNIITGYCILLSRYLNSDNYEQHYICVKLSIKLTIANAEQKLLFLS